MVRMEAQVNMLYLLAQPQKELQLDLKTNNTQNRQKPSRKSSYMEV